MNGCNKVKSTFCVWICTLFALGVLYQLSTEQDVFAQAPGPDCEEGFHDHDEDLVCSDTDVCPFDPLKWLEEHIDPANPAIYPGSVSSLNPNGFSGKCACGIDETDPNNFFDTDGDGRINCADECRYDFFKTEAGICGCGRVDFDSDGDGIFDCLDGCPTDPRKSHPLRCGCGFEEREFCHFLISEYKPSKTRVNYTKQGRVLDIIMDPLNIPGLEYHLEIVRLKNKKHKNGRRKKNKTISVVKTTSNIHTITGIKRGVYKLRYLVFLPDPTDPEEDDESFISSTLRFRIGR